MVLNIVKLLFTTLCFIGLHSVPNLIVMLFNLLYPVSIVGFHFKGCVFGRESMKTQPTEDWRLCISTNILWRGCTYNKVLEYNLLIRLRVQLYLYSGIKYCKVVIYNIVFCWLIFRAKFDCNVVQSFVPYIYCGIQL